MKNKLISMLLVLALVIMTVPFSAVPASATAPKITTNLELVARAVDVAKNYKTLYVMGAWGSPLNASNKQSLINKNDYNAGRASMINAASSDTFAFDCVCFIKALLWGWDGDTSQKNGGAVFASNGVPDKGTEEFIKLCNSVSTDFSNIEVGELLWMSGHVGLYIGDGLAVECTPAWSNDVQITACNRTIAGYNTRTWSKHGKLPYIEYVSDENVANYNSTSSTSAAGCYKVIVDSVVVRRSPSNGGDVVDHVYKGDLVTVVSSGKNLAGNIWYKLSSGNYVYPDGNARFTKITDPYIVLSPDSGYASSYPSTDYVCFKVIPNPGVSGVAISNIKKIGVRVYFGSSEIAYSEDSINISYDFLHSWYPITSTKTEFKNTTNGYDFYCASGITYYYKVRVQYVENGVTKTIDLINHSSSNGFFSFTGGVGRVETYKVVYDANGGSGAPSSQTKTHGVTLTLSSTVPTRSGYAFLGWSTSSTATSATYSAGSSFTSNANTTLYAVWKANTYTVSYNANGGSGAPSSQTKTYGVTLYLSSTVPARSGYTFLGWSTSSTATSATYSAGGSFTANADTTLYAVWKANTYTVSYNANGGSGAPSSQTKTYGVTLYLSSTVPTRSGYTFLGWSTSSTATSATYSAGGSFTSNANTTLYAVWKSNHGTYGSNHLCLCGCGAWDPNLQDTATYSKSITIKATTNNALGYGPYAVCSDNDAYFHTGDTITANGHVINLYGNKWYVVSYNGKTYYADGGYFEEVPETYTVSYNANGGSGAPSSQTKTHGVTLTLSSTKPTRDGYTFLGWSTSSTATSATYSAGGSFTANADTTLYAVWKKNEDTSSKFDAVVSAPASYSASGEFEVLVYIRNIKVNGGLSRIGFTFSYDSNSLTLLNTVNSDNSVDCAKKMPSSWENVSTASAGKINVFYMNMTDSVTVSADDGIILSFKFKAKSTASSDLTFTVSEAEGSDYPNPDVTLKGTGSSAKTVYVAYMLGDINGNGKIDALDYGLLKRACLGTYTLTDVQKLAGDINGNGKIEALDYGLLKRACLGTYTIK